MIFVGVHEFSSRLTTFSSCRRQGSHRWPLVHKSKAPPLHHGGLPGWNLYMSTINSAIISTIANKQTLQCLQDYHQQTIFNLILFRALKRKPYFQLENSRWRRKGVESCYSGTYPVKTFSPIFLPTAAAGYNMQAFFLLFFPTDHS